MLECHRTTEFLIIAQFKNHLINSVFVSFNTSKSVLLNVHPMNLQFLNFASTNFTSSKLQFIKWTPDSFEPLQLIFLKQHFLNSPTNSVEKNLTSIKWVAWKTVPLITFWVIWICSYMLLEIVHPFQYDCEIVFICENRQFLDLTYQIWFVGSLPLWTPHSQKSNQETGNF